LSHKKRNNRLTGRKGHSQLNYKLRLSNKKEKKIKNRKRKKNIYKEKQKKIDKKRFTNKNCPNSKKSKLK